MTAPSAGSAPAPAADPRVRPPISIGQIFREFLFIGATSFGGGVVAYLRNALVRKRQWLDDLEFVELLGISQTLPGLTATNMAVLIGDRLRGPVGALAALGGMCLPGGTFMFIAAIAYGASGGRPLATAALKGVAAAAVGLILATVMQLGRKALTHRYDLIAVALAVLSVNRLHQPVIRVLLVLGTIMILWYRPGGRAIRQPPESENEEANIG